MLIDEDWKAAPQDKPFAGVAGRRTSLNVTGATSWIIDIEQRVQFQSLF
jgi:hypothetical protein